MNWRRSEMISLSTFIMGLTWIWWASGRVSTWDATKVRVDEILPVIDDNSKKVAILIDNMQDIREDLKYLRRHARE